MPPPKLENVKRPPSRTSTPTTDGQRPPSRGTPKVPLSRGPSSRSMTPSGSFRSGTPTAKSADQSQTEPPQEAAPQEPAAPAQEPTKESEASAAPAQDAPGTKKPPPAPRRNSDAEAPSNGTTGKRPPPPPRRPSTQEQEPVREGQLTKRPTPKPEPAKEEEPKPTEESKPDESKPADSKPAADEKTNEEEAAYPPAELKDRKETPPAEESTTKPAEEEPSEKKEEPKEEAPAAQQEPATETQQQEPPKEAAKEDAEASKEPAKADEQQKEEKPVATEEPKESETQSAPAAEEERPAKTTEEEKPAASSQAEPAKVEEKAPTEEAKPEEKPSSSEPAKVQEKPAEEKPAEEKPAEMPAPEAKKEEPKKEEPKKEGEVKPSSTTSTTTEKKEDKAPAEAPKEEKKAEPKKEERKPTPAAEQHASRSQSPADEGGPSTTARGPQRSAQSSRTPSAAASTAGDQPPPQQQQQQQQQQPAPRSTTIETLSTITMSATLDGTDYMSLVSLFDMDKNRVFRRAQDEIRAALPQGTRVEDVKIEAAMGEQGAVRLISHVVCTQDAATSVSESAARYLGEPGAFEGTFSLLQQLTGGPRSASSHSRRSNYSSQAPPVYDPTGRGREVSEDPYRSPPRSTARTASVRSVEPSYSVVEPPAADQDGKNDMPLVPSKHMFVQQFGAYSEERSRSRSNTPKERSRQDISSLPPPPSQKLFMPSRTTAEFAQPQPRFEGGRTALEQSRALGMSPPPSTYRGGGSGGGGAGGESANYIAQLRADYNRERATDALPPPSFNASRQMEASPRDRNYGSYGNGRGSPQRDYYERDYDNRRESAPPSSYTPRQQQQRGSPQRYDDEFSPRSPATYENWGYDDRRSQYSGRDQHTGPGRHQDPHRFDQPPAGLGSRSEPDRYADSRMNMRTHIVRSTTPTRREPTPTAVAAAGNYRSAERRPAYEPIAAASSPNGNSYGYQGAGYDSPGGNGYYEGATSDGSHRSALDHFYRRKQRAPSLERQRKDGSVANAPSASPAPSGGTRYRTRQSLQRSDEPQGDSLRAAPRRQDYDLVEDSEEAQYSQRGQRQERNQIHYGGATRIRTPGRY